MLENAEPGPTRYPDANTIILALLAAVREVLGEELVGFYLYGSLSLGDFDPLGSDIDFLVVTRGELPPEMLERLKEMHAGIAASGLPYADHLEGSYIPAAAVRRYDPQNNLHPTIGVDWKFQVAPHRSNWIIERHIVREHGATLYGPPPETLIDPVTAEDLRGAVCNALTNHWRRQLDDHEWLRPRDYQAFAALTMCRALYALEVGDIVSKPKAAQWALENLEPRWRPLIERALAWRHEHAPDDLTETLDFIRYAVEYGDTLCADDD